MRTGYDLFLSEPNKIEEQKCNVCGTVCNVKRNEYGPTSFVAAMAKKYRYYDEFTCPNSDVEWHENALDLLLEIEATSSKRVADLIRQDLKELLEENKL